MITSLNYTTAKAGEERGIGGRGHVSVGCPFPHPGRVIRFGERGKVKLSRALRDAVAGLKLL